MSCEKETPKQKLSRGEKVLIDSLYKDKIIVLRPELDSLCDLRETENYQRIKDSIISIRLAEIEQFLPNQ